MKKPVLFLLISCLLSAILTGCFRVIPASRPSYDPDSLGEAKIFQKDGITLQLTDSFVEQESQRGFDAYYVADFAGAMVLIEDFASEEGLADRSLEQFIQDVIEYNGHTDIIPLNKNGLWYYINDVTDVRYYSFCYKGSNAFYFVQYSCILSDAEALEPTIFQWAQAVVVE